MPHVDYDNREIVFKVVYYGPGMSGKTTNLACIHRTVAADRRGDLVTLDTAEERTLFFDFLPVDLGCIGGFGVRFNLYTVPGQMIYEASRRLVLDGADGVVFVADSAAPQLERNLWSYRMLDQNLRSYGLDVESFPVALQYNKRDCEEPIRLGTLERLLGLDGIPVFEAVAVQGRGVMETIRCITKRVIERFEI